MKYTSSQHISFSDGSIYFKNRFFYNKKAPLAEIFLKSVGKELISIDVLDQALIPGKGAPADFCGKFTALGVCPSCKKLFWIRRRCESVKCPHCWHRWRFKETLRSVGKLEAYRRFKYSISKGKWKFHHLVLSPPQQELIEIKRAKNEEEKNKRVFEKLLGQLKFILQYWGVYEGGLIIFHPYRLKGLEDGSDEEVKKWREIRKKENWRDYVYFSPHFHIFVIEKVIPAEVSKKIYELTGWVCKRITKPGSKVSVGNLADLALAVSYCLMHAGIYNFRTIRWFGKIAQFKTHKVEILEEVAEALLAIQDKLNDSKKINKKQAKSFARVKKFYGLKCPECKAELIVLSAINCRSEEVRKFIEWSPPLKNCDGVGELLI